MINTQGDIYQELLQQVKDKKPLIHHLTNYVTVNDCANVVLAIGGSPIMADFIDEIDELVPKADALLVNLGTLNKHRGDSILRACSVANTNHIPIVLDPVGVSASSFRLQILKEIISNYKIAIIKGNASEIRTVAGLASSSKGVDATEGEEVTPAELRKLSHKLNSVIALTGEKDVITYNDNVISIANGSKFLAQLTGTGCMIGSIIATFASVTNDFLSAATLGVLIMGVAGELSHPMALEKGMGSFKISIFDSISKIDENVLRKVAKIYEE